MEQTTNFKLNQWEKTDRIQMEDFNADNAKLEAALSVCGNCRVVTGSYIGTGTYGKSNENCLTFDTAPLAVLVSCSSGCMLLIRGSNTSPHFSDSATVSVHVTWTNNSVYWYYINDSSYQMNTQNKTYFYAALFQVDENLT